MQYDMLLALQAERIRVLKAALREVLRGVKDKRLRELGQAALDEEDTLDNESRYYV
jgi:hypothetical protein